MPLGLHNLKVNSGAKKRKKPRAGRGNASGHGNYSTRGLKGQKARSGASGLKRKGMKMILQRIPKYKGMKSLQPDKQVVNLGQLDKNFKDGDVVGKKEMIQKGLISTMRLEVKILGNGELTKKIEVHSNLFSESAKKAIEKAGGKVVVVKHKRKGDKPTFDKKEKKQPKK